MGTELERAPEDWGTIGELHDPLDAVFTYLEGLRVRVHPDLSDLVLYDFVEKAQEVDEEDPRSILLIKTTLREFIHPDDFEGFWTTARRNRQQTADLLPVMWKIVERLTNRPTQQPSDSSAGRTATAPKSADGSAQRAITELEQRDRPDLALVVVQAQEARGARSA
jgi:hypothetical protein